jgi:hypothetical protein
MSCLLWNWRLITMITLSCCCIRSRASLIVSTLWHPYSYKERQRLFRDMPGKHWWEVEVWLCPYWTSALEGGAWPAPHPDRFTHGNETRYPLYRRLIGLWDRAGRIRKVTPPLGFESRIVLPKARRYIDWSIPLVPIRVNVLLHYPLLIWRLPSCLLFDIFYHFSSPVFMLHVSPMSHLIRSLQQCFVKVIILSGTSSVCCYLRLKT